MLLKTVYGRVCPQNFELRQAHNIKYLNAKNNRRKNFKRLPEKDVVLLGILRQRRRFAELRTAKAVEACKKKVSQEINSLFQRYYDSLTDLAQIMIKGIMFPESIVKPEDIEELFINLDSILKDSLLEQFNSPIINTLQKFDVYNQGKALTCFVDNYASTKRRTVLITSYVEAVSRKTLGDVLDSVLGDFININFVLNVDVSSYLLPKLGINSSAEKVDFEKELINRLEGVLKSLKVNLVNKIHRQIAAIFYENYDVLVDPLFNDKIHGLKRKILNRQASLPDLDYDLLEA